MIACGSALSAIVKRHVLVNGPHNFDKKAVELTEFRTSPLKQGVWAFTSKAVVQNENRLIYVVPHPGLQDRAEVTGHTILEPGFFNPVSLTVRPWDRTLMDDLEHFDYLCRLYVVENTIRGR